MLWQLCAWLDRFQCRKTKSQFYTHVLRWQDVIPNYFTALFAKLVVDEAALLDWRAENWPVYIKQHARDLHDYIRWKKQDPNLKSLPQSRQNDDYFANDLGLAHILRAAKPQPGEEAAPEHRYAPLPHGCIAGVYALDVPEPKLENIEMNSLPLLFTTTKEMALSHRLLAVDQEDQVMEEEEAKEQPPAQKKPATLYNEHGQVVGRIGDQVDEEV